MNSAGSILTNWISAASVTLLLTACGGGGGSSNGTGTLNLGITDAAIDTAESVVVEFQALSYNLPVETALFIISLNLVQPSAANLRARSQRVWLTASPPPPATQTATA